MTRHLEAREILSEIRSLSGPDIEDVVNLFKFTRPETKQEIKSIGFKLKKLGDGVFRTAFRIDDLPLVVKIPKEDGDLDYDSCLGHARAEFKKIKTIKNTKKLKPFWRYLPEILYFDKHTGLILMPEYRQLHWREAEAISCILSYLSDDLKGDDEGGDLHSSNIAYDPVGDRYVIIDLGYF